MKKSTNMGGIRPVAALALAAALGFTPAFAQASSDMETTIKAAKAEGTVMVYHTSPVTLIRPIFRAFEKKYGIKVQNFHATGTPLSVRFSTEAKAGTPQADVLSLSDTTAFRRNASLFQQLNAKNFPAFSHLSKKAKLEGGIALSPSLFSFSLAYNTDKVKKADVPQTWENLADPKWRGKIMLVDPRSSRTYRAAFVVVDRLHPGLLARIAKNDFRLVESGTPAAQQIAAGTSSIAFTLYPAHVNRLMRKGAPINFAAIGGPEIARNAWWGATKGAHPNAGRLFMAFFFSDEGLRIYCKRAPGTKTTLDPTGKRTGCDTLSPDAEFLPNTPPSKKTEAAVIRGFGLK